MSILGMYYSIHHICYRPLEASELGLRHEIYHYHSAHEHQTHNSKVHQISSPEER